MCFSVFYSRPGTARTIHDNYELIKVILEFWGAGAYFHASRLTSGLCCSQLNEHRFRERLGKKRGEADRAESTADEAGERERVAQQHKVAKLCNMDLSQN